MPICPQTVCSIIASFAYAANGRYSGCDSSINHSRWMSAMGRPRLKPRWSLSILQTPLSAHSRRSGPWQNGGAHTGRKPSKATISTIRVLMVAASIPSAARRIRVANKMPLQGMEPDEECFSQNCRFGGNACFRVHKWPWQQCSCFGSRPRRTLEAACWSRAWVSRDLGVARWDPSHTARLCDRILSAVVPGFACSGARCHRICFRGLSRLSLGAGHWLPALSRWWR